jgi:DNA-binding response OmpR family regulator
VTVPLTGKRLLVVSADVEFARVVADASSRLGASVVLCRGGRAALDEADGAGAHAAIVDLPVPDFRPDALLLALRARQLKTVAVSGVLRAARYAATAMRFGAETFLEKPFDVEEALAVLTAALSSATANTAPPSAAPAEPSPPVRDERGQGSTPTPTPPDPLPASPDEIDDATQTANYPLADDLDSCIFSEALPALDETLVGIPLAPRPREGLAEPLPATAVPRARKPGPLALPVGDLASTGVPRLMTALHTARTTGALTLARPPVKKLILLEEGRAVFAASNLPSERFAARCVREGILSARALKILVAEIGPREPLNEALLARGLLDDAQRTRMFVEQVREIIWSTFDWREGSYQLLAGPRARRPITRVDIAPQDLVLEGFRRMATIERLREDLPATLALARATTPAVDFRDLPMAGPEALMLAHADGTKTISDLVVLSGMDERDALAFLAGCRALGILDEVSRALAGTGRMGFM